MSSTPLTGSDSFWRLWSADLEFVTEDQVGALRYVRTDFRSAAVAGRRGRADEAYAKRRVVDGRHGKLRPEMRMPAAVGAAARAAPDVVERHTACRGTGTGARAPVIVDAVRGSRCAV